MVSFKLLTFPLLYGVAFGNPAPAPAPAQLVKRPASSMKLSLLALQLSLLIYRLSLLSTILHSIPHFKPMYPDTRLSSAYSCLSVVPVASTVTLTTYAPTVTLVNPCDTISNPYTVGGDTFDIYCDYYQYGNILLELFDVPDMPTCIATCTNTQGCIGISCIQLSLDGYMICSVLETLEDYGETDNGADPPGYGFAMLTNQTLPADLFTPCGDEKRDVGKRCIGEN